MDKTNTKKAMKLFGTAIEHFRLTDNSSKGYVMALTKELRLDIKNTNEEEIKYSDSDEYIRDDYMRWKYEYERKYIIDKGVGITGVYKPLCRYYRGVSMHRVETDSFEERKTGVKDVNFMRITINDFDENWPHNPDKLDMEIYVQFNKWINGKFQYDAAMGRRLTIKNREINVFNANVALTGIDYEAIGTKDEADMLKQLENFMENISKKIKQEIEKKQYASTSSDYSNENKSSCGSCDGSSWSAGPGYPSGVSQCDVCGKRYESR